MSFVLIAPPVHIEIISADNPFAVLIVEIGQNGRIPGIELECEANGFVRWGGGCPLLFVADLDTRSGNRQRNAGP